MMRFAYDKCSSMDYLDLTVLKSLALDCLSSKRDNIIVLDGLDEGMNGEAEKAIQWCLDDLIKTVSSRGCHVRLLICGQEDGRIDPLLAPYPSIRLHTVDLHLKDIEDYCEAQATSIATRFRLSSDDKRGLIDKVAKASNGMFLYTKVVLANLASMGSKKEYKSELANDKFPRDLNEAYERVVQRVMSSAQASAKKILGLLVCSERPLRWREIQSRFCIDAEEAVCDPDDLRADTCKQLCSSLVDAIDCEMFPGVKSEQTITMIHETASKYLVHTGTINLMQEHIDMSLFCCLYLSSEPFLATDSACLEHVVQSGYFSFMDYAATHYRSHIQKAESFKEDMTSYVMIGTVKKAALDLEETYCSNGAKNIGEANNLGANLDLAIQETVSAVRKAIDKERATLLENVDFQDLEGPKRYKCSRLKCSKFSVGYASESALQRHLASHERPFRCNDGACFAHIVGCASQQALRDHAKAFHTDESHSKITFPIGKKTRKINLIDACKTGNLKEVKLLHRSGADLAGSSLYVPPLRVAFEAGHGHICKYLIDNGVDPFEAGRESYDMSPIFLAIHRKDFFMLELFLLGPQDLTTTQPFFRRAVSEIFKNYPTAVTLLLRLSRTRPSLGPSEAVETVISKRLADVFGTWGGEGRHFVPHHSSDSNQRTKSSLDPSEAVETVISKRFADTWGGQGRPFVPDHSNDSKPLHRRFCEIFPNLYDHNEIFSLDPNCQEHSIYYQSLKLGRNLLHNAFRQKSYPLAAFLMDIDCQKQLQIQTADGDSPLHSFIVQSCNTSCDGCVVMAQRLSKLDGGRWANVPNHKGLTPVHSAIAYDIAPATLQVILECTEDLNRKDDEGESPLHYVENKQSLGILLQHKDVDLFSRNREGQTAFAALCGHRYRNSRIPETRKDKIKRLVYRMKRNMQNVDGEGGVLLEALLEADVRLAWTADQSVQRLTPLHHAFGLGQGQGSRCYAKILLQLQEVEQVLQAFLSTGSEGSEEVREFADKMNLGPALEAMDKIGFGLPVGH